MFQSGHAAGTYHAVGRVVGGSPIYVSDKPGQQNFDLLRKLMNTCGKIDIPEGHGVPTRDCLFHDPTQEDILLKIFLHPSGDEKLLGVFNARFNPDAPDTPRIKGSISPVEVHDIEYRRYVVFAHFANELRVMERDELWELELSPLGCELFLVVPIYESKQTACVLLGDTSLFNSSETLWGALYETPGRDTCEVSCEGGRQFTAWCEKRPAQVIIEESEAEWTFDETTGRLEIVNLSGASCRMTIEF